MNLCNLTLYIDRKKKYKYGLIGIFYFLYDTVGGRNNAAQYNTIQYTSLQ